MFEIGGARSVVCYLNTAEDFPSGVKAQQFHMLKQAALKHKNVKKKISKCYK